MAAISQTFDTTPWATHRTSQFCISGTKRLLHEGFQEQRRLANCLQLPAGGPTGAQAPRGPAAQKPAHRSLMYFPDSLAKDPLSEEYLLIAPHSPTLGSLCYLPPPPNQKALVIGPSLSR